jgi:pyruvate carboxylase
LRDAFEQAQRESLTPSAARRVRRKVHPRARHIEVQLLGDQHGNLVHLYERDCSVQRRHQKVVEIAPAPNLDPPSAKRSAKRRWPSAAPSITRTPARSSSWSTRHGEFYFIEVNPRIQVEHTVTEEVTGVDIVKTQILIAQGAADDPEIGLPTQADIRTHGFAMQCRVTTEDPANGFRPTTAASRTTARPAAWASASTPARRSPARWSRRTTTRCW